MYFYFFFFLQKTIVDGRPCQPLFWFITFCQQSTFSANFCLTKCFFCGCASLRMMISSQQPIVFYSILFCNTEQYWRNPERHQPFHISSSFGVLYGTLGSCKVLLGPISSTYLVFGPAIKIQSKSTQGMNTSPFVVIYLSFIYLFIHLFMHCMQGK